jgi:hypothetical protein
LQGGIDAWRKGNYPLEVRITTLTTMAGTASVTISAETKSQSSTDVLRHDAI